MSKGSAVPLNRRTVLGGLAAASLPGGARASVATMLTFGTLYGTVTASGISLTPEAANLVGKEVAIRGYMAPPLKAESDFFVLTRFPMSICPFCSNAADWPIDIVVVKLRDVSPVIEPAYAIIVTGTLEFGVKVDQDTGFVSMVRLTEARWLRV